MKKGCLIILILLAAFWIIGKITGGGKNGDSQSGKVSYTCVWCKEMFVGNAGELNCYYYDDSYGGCGHHSVTANTLTGFCSSQHCDLYQAANTDNTTFTSPEFETNNTIESNDQLQSENQETSNSQNLNEDFLLTPTGERYKIVKVEIPNHDEEQTTSEIEITGPVEGLYINVKDENRRAIRIVYDESQILVLHWKNSEDQKRVEAYIDSKGYFSFDGEDFEYDRFGQGVDEVDELKLVGRFTGDIYTWSPEWIGD